MLNTALLLTASGLLTGQATYPDELDILRGADTTPQIELVLDASGSMTWSESIQSTSCSHYYAQNRATNDGLISSCCGNGWSGRAAANPLYPLASFEMLQAILTGCTSANDGIIDQWAHKVMFAVREFGGGNTCAGRINLLANFDPTLQNKVALETAVQTMQFGGRTPMAEAYALAASHISGFFTDVNSAKCRQNYLVVMTDGEGNGWLAPTVNLGAGNAPVTFKDVGCGAAGGCTCAAAANFADRAARHLAFQDANLTQNVDALPNVTGVQPIRTYTIQFGTQSVAAQTVLTNMALQGDGFPYQALSYQQLNNAFTQIILSIVARSNVAFSPGTVQNDGIFSGNYVYTSAFAPYQAGHWFGTTKKYCVMPTGPADNTCLFLEDAQGNIFTNTQPQDIWTGTRSLSATTGGAGQLIWSTHFGVNASNAAVPGTPLRRRTILTWRPGTSGYVRVDDTGAFTIADSWAPNPCAHWSLLNKLHGFAPAVTDCAGGNYAPTAFDPWPLGDTVHGDTVVMKYSKNCEAGGDNCYVATVANDGMLHFFNAFTGVETSAVIPGHLWSANQVATHQLKDLMNQPNLNEMRRFFFDGGVRLYHVDGNNNGYIDNGETAKLVAGLGRGGKSYVLWDVSTFNGVPTTASNPPQELMVDESSPFRNLRETWAAPWIGQYKHSDGLVHDVAVFPTGHDRTLDVPTANLGALTAGLAPPSPDSKTNPQNQGCSAFGLPSELCSPPINLNGCTPCNNSSPLACPLLGGGVIGVPSFYCYDWPGWTAFAPPPFNTGGGPGVGFNMLLGPFSWSNAGKQAIAYRVVFSHFDLQPNDYIAVLDRNQNEVGRLTGSLNGGTSPVSMPWVNDTSFYLRLVTNGIDDASSRGFQVQRVEFLRADAGTAPSTTWRHSIYVQDIGLWNGPANSGAARFAAQPAASDLRQQAGLLLRITSNCEGLTSPTEVCLDANSVGPNGAMSDLNYMTCPISAEPAILAEGGLLTGIYWGDECGQIFRASRDASGVWSARRLLRTNRAQAGGLPIVAQSRDLRRIFTRLELVLSTCNGNRAVGVYFGTGNLQRPAMFDNFTNPAPATFPGMTAPAAKPTDLIGVVWDHYNLPQDAGPENLTNITSVVQADPRAGNGVNGWIIELGPEEKMLRDPVVLDGVAYFKTYEPRTAASECVSADGVEFIYAMDNCTGRPLADANGNGGIDVFDRTVGGATNDIGGDLLLFTPPDGDAFVSNADLTVQAKANLPSKGTKRQMRIFLWRTTVDPLL
jgi:hypothetical protein